MKNFLRALLIGSLMFALAWITLKFDAAVDHFKEDHTTHHFNAELIEVIRQTILEKHPELVVETPIAVIEE